MPFDAAGGSAAGGWRLPVTVCPGGGLLRPSRDDLRLRLRYWSGARAVTPVPPRGRPAWPTLGPAPEQSPQPGGHSGEARIRWGLELPGSGEKLKIQALEAGHPKVEETAEGATATITLELLAREPGVRMYAADDGLTGKEAEAAFRAGAAVRLILGVNTP